MKTMDEPEVVQALPPEEAVELTVTSSFYEDVITDLNFNPEGAKRQSLEFEDSLKRQLASLQETTSVILSGADE